MGSVGGFRWYATAMAGSAFLCCTCPLEAQQATDPATAPSSPAIKSQPLALPDLKVADKDLGSERKFYVFHKPGVSVEQATADLKFCWHFLPRGGTIAGGMFIIRETRYIPISRYRYDPSVLRPLVHAAIVSIIDGPIERSMRQLRMFRCMVPRGYDRYRTSEAVWLQLNSGDQEQSIKMQAAIAAGPVPPTPKIDS